MLHNTGIIFIKINNNTYISISLPLKRKFTHKCRVQAFCLCHLSGMHLRLMNFIKDAICLCGIFVTYWNNVLSFSWRVLFRVCVLANTSNNKVHCIYVFKRSHSWWSIHVDNYVNRFTTLISTSESRLLTVRELIWRLGLMKIKAHKYKLDHNESSINFKPVFFL